MVVVTARRYSRMMGLVSEERIQVKPGQWRSTISLILISWAGLAIDHSRQTATASTRYSSISFLKVASVSASSSGVMTSPSAFILSVTGRVR